MSDESKVVVSFPRKNKRSVVVGDKTIKIEPYISIAKQAFLIETFLNDCLNLEEDEKIFTASPFDRFAGENSFTIALLHTMTDLDILSTEVPVDLEDVIRSGVFKKITERIDNYSEVVELREAVLQDVLRERYSIMGLIKSFSDMSMDDVQEMGRAIKDLQEEYKDSPIGDLLNEAKAK